MADTKLFILLFFSILSSFAQSINYDHISIEEIKIDSSSIRAIYAQQDSSLYYTSSRGTIGLVAPSGKILYEKQIRYDTIRPHFRAIASNGTSIFVLGVESPALLYKFENQQASLVYQENHPKVFYDAMAFFDTQNGIAMGDPTDDCLSIITTRDGGKTWQKIPCKNLPITEEGEAAFAASNGNIAISGQHAWLVTGGKRSRVFHTPDMGATWTVVDTPITQGGQMTGIYSVDFYDEKHGIIFGGNWGKPNENTANKAITKDGGKTWKLIADGNGPGYKSCVRYVPNTNGKELVAVGFTGISHSNDGGSTWRKVSNDNYYTIRFVNQGFAWLGGTNKVGKLVFLR